jgi:hypothetical protein
VRRGGRPSASGVVRGPKRSSGRRIGMGWFALLGERTHPADTHAQTDTLRAAGHPMGLFFVRSRLKTFGRGQPTGGPERWMHPSEGALTAPTIPTPKRTPYGGPDTLWRVRGGCIGGTRPVARDPPLRGAQTARQYPSPKRIPYEHLDTL